MKWWLGMGGCAFIFVAAALTMWWPRPAPRTAFGPNHAIGWECCQKPAPAFTLQTSINASTPSAWRINTSPDPQEQRIDISSWREVRQTGIRESNGDCWDISWEFQVSPPFATGRISEALYVRSPIIEMVLDRENGGGNPLFDCYGAPIDSLHLDNFKWAGNPNRAPDHIEVEFIDRYGHVWEPSGWKRIAPTRIRQ